ncbi:MAG: MurR/RpiR family transcriptional regulator [Balneolales bacterium]|nr:MurR/RpiR family transcriptional regulator [Balneolales bacterium]
MTPAKEYSAEQLIRMIASEYEQLPRNQKAVADFLIKNLNEAAFLSVVEIGERCGVSKATVVRFAQRLGFDGFMLFRDALQASVQKRFSESDRFHLIRHSAGKSVYQVAQQDVSNINRTIENLNLEDFNRVAERIAASRVTYTYGLGISALVAQITAYSLCQVAIRAQAVISGHLSFEEQVLFMDERDVLVCFSFPPYSGRTIEVAALARSRGVEVIGITDIQTAPITEHCTHSLTVKSENLLFTNSIAALSVVVNALVTEIAVRNEDKALGYIEEVNRLMKQGGHFRV